jgi:hypothetical protein
VTTLFEQDISDPKLSAIIDLFYRDRPLLIAFGGIAGALAIPPYEFFGLTRDLDINKIYLRDLSQTWYHSGLPGISRNIEETASFLKRKASEASTDKVVLVGNSMGGYAAILFGILLKATVVHAFSPHTFIGNRKYIRSKNRIEYLHAKFSRKYFDLRRVMAVCSNAVSCNVYYDPADKLDKSHAFHLKGSNNVTLFPFHGAGHCLVKALRDSGQLRDILLSSLNHTDNGHPTAKVASIGRTSTP